MAALQVAKLLSIGLGHDSHLHFAAMVRVMAITGGPLELRCYLAMYLLRINPMPVPCLVALLNRETGWGGSTRAKHRSLFLWNASLGRLPSRTLAFGHHKWTSRVCPRPWHIVLGGCILDTCKGPCSGLIIGSP